MINLGQLEEIADLRAVWPHEALDFTPWLAREENMALLADAVGLDITVDETESAVGDFQVDISASETGTDRKIIIENQLEDTDYDHLGKLITYASGKSADVIIWVVKRAREEHKAAIEWLNNRTDERIGFFLCEIKLYRIGGSLPAVKFEVIEKPNDWTKEVKKNEASTETRRQRLEYWSAFQDYAFRRTPFSGEFNRRKPSASHWMNYAIGSSECYISVTQIRNRDMLSIMLYIPDNKRLYQTLLARREEIEQAAGIPFSWYELPERKASKIGVEQAAEFGDRGQWDSQFAFLADMMVRLKRAVEPYI